MQQCFLIRSQESKSTHNAKVHNDGDNDDNEDDNDDYEDDVDDNDVMTMIMIIIMIHPTRIRYIIHVSFTVESVGHVIVFTYIRHLQEQHSFFYYSIILRPVCSIAKR